MRITCPNCDAEYEVDAALVPEGGRDVQCSNCGHAWFQLPPDQEAMAAEEAALFDPPPAVTAAAEGAGAEAASPESSQTIAEPDGPAGGEPAPHARSLDESVLAVLREEAEREVAQRAAEARTGLETQEEMPLETAAPGTGATGLGGGIAGAAARRIAKLKGIDPDAGQKPASRRELLPEIEEINSTLRAKGERRSGDAAAVADTWQSAGRQRSGFRSGFALMMLLAVVLVVVYVAAPRIVQQFPGSESAMSAYVAGVDAARLFLDQMLQKAIVLIRGVSGEAQG